MRAPEADVSHLEEQLVASAAELLARRAPPPHSSIDVYVTAMSARLEASGASGVSAEQIAHLRGLQLERDRSERRITALGQVDHAVDRLSRLSAPAEILGAAPQELVEIAELRRAIVGRLQRGNLTVMACSVRGEPGASRSLLAALQGTSIRLAHPHVETELLRRHHAVTLNVPASPQRIHPALQTAMDWRGVIAAPLVVDGEMSAVLYADRGPRAELDAVHQEIVIRFTSELARTFELAQLRRAVRSERDATRRFAVSLEHRSRELWADVEGVTVGAGVGPTRSATRPGLSHLAALGGSALTQRELEVLQLLSAGHSNRRIATDLVLSPATVKSHVYRILSKLQVANRAEAVALYLGRLDLHTGHR